jgi:hypothetical protein
LLELRGNEVDVPVMTKFGLRIEVVEAAFVKRALLALETAASTGKPSAIAV